MSTPLPHCRGMPPNAKPFVERYQISMKYKITFMHYWGDCEDNDEKSERGKSIHVVWLTNRSKLFTVSFSYLSANPPPGLASMECLDWDCRQRTFRSADVPLPSPALPSTCLEASGGRPTLGGPISIPGIYVASGMGGQH